MMQRFGLVVLTVVLLGSTAFGQVFVNDNFDSYASDAAFEAVWGPIPGSSGLPVGILVPRTLPPFPPAPFDGSGDNTVTPPVEPLVGQAVSFSNGNGINRYAGPAFSLSPSATQAIKLTADMFDFVNGNRRFSVGLRHFDGTTSANLLELGFWNANTFDPRNPGGPCSTPDNSILTSAYGHRLALFGPVGGDLICSPNWQYYPLPIEFDDPLVDHNGDGRLGNGDGRVTPTDVGPGWHRYTATIKETEVTFTIDLFRNGTIDSEVTWPITPQALPFNTLQIGGPSGVTMNQFTMVDNIRLELINVSTGPTGDFNNDGLWNCADINQLTNAIATGSANLSFDMNGDGQITINDVTDPATGWLKVGGANNPAQTSGNPFRSGDANLDGVVDGSDFGIWNSGKFTSNTAWCSGNFNADGVVDGSDFGIWNSNKFTSSDAFAAVPEPASICLLVVGIIAAVAHRRRK